jgi:hypothetical protein
MADFVLVRGAWRQDRTADRSRVAGTLVFAPAIAELAEYNYRRLEQSERLEKIVQGSLSILLGATQPSVVN